MAKLTDYDYCQSISDLHYAGVKWTAIAIIKSISYDHLIKEKKNPKSLLYKILTVGTKTKTRDLAEGIITDIAMNGSKDSDKFNAAKYMIDSEPTVTTTTTSTTTSTDIAKEIMNELNG